MGYKPDHKARTRAKVLAAAAARFRAKGIDATGLPDIMRRAGLTHGGFYFHFRSKDDLVAAAIERMFDEVIERVERFGEQSAPGHAFPNFADSYLSLAHRDQPAKGCPIAALAGDIRHHRRGARKAFQTGLSRHVTAIAELLPLKEGKFQIDLASCLLSEMVGALTMARCACEQSDAERILDVSKASVKARAAAEGDRVEASKATRSRRSWQR
jgi:TetR/AcrR family transcriptional regulator, transcriptional repressor for nem operon